MAYDGAGRRTMKLDPRGNRASFTYDAAGQTTVERYADGTRVSLAYDAVGNWTRMDDSVGITTTMYDELNRVRVQHAAIGGRLTYAFDAAGRRSRMIDPANGRFTYGYDDADRMIKVVNPQNKRTTLVYDSAGRQTLQIHGNGSRTTQAYDAANRLTVQIQADGIGVSRRTTNLYDATNKRTLMHESSGVRTSWTYDASGQLRREQRNGSGSFDVTHLYDPVGNRTLMIDSGIRTTATFDAANELLVERTNSARTTYQYDANGNTTRKDTGSALTIYRWDVRNRMTAAQPVSTPVTSTYDGSGKRVKKEVAANTKQFLYDFENLLSEADGSGNVEREYTSTVEQYGELLSAYSGTSSYYVFDPQYSTEALLDDSGSVTDRYKYRAFGLASHPTGSSNQPHTFVGRQGYYADSEVALYYVRNNIYDPASARWMKEDPIGFGEYEQNLYRYCQNDPLNQTDPSGFVIAPPPPKPEVRKAELERKFMEWYNANKDTSWTAKLPVCPCKLPLKTTRQGEPLMIVFEFLNPDPKVWEDPSDTFIALFRRFWIDFHPGAVYDLRSKPIEGGYGQQCTYDEHGKLIQDIPGCGTADKVSPGHDRRQHKDADVDPFIWAIELDGGAPGKGWKVGDHVRKYFKVRPPGLGKGCDDSLPEQFLVLPEDKPQKEAGIPKRIECLLEVVRYADAGFAKPTAKDWGELRDFYTRLYFKENPNANKDKDDPVRERWIAQRIAIDSKRLFPEDRVLVLPPP